ncbi:MAG TPA: HAMP domain-containing sensor histidine kinase [Streptosporangiaceae bacterium]|jgi:two-component system OmpR family sensor kinase
MSRPGKLSLRARMLVLLIGVTTLFLLIMGTVSTLVLRNQWSKQFNAGLVTAAARSPADLAAKPGGYSAIEVTVRLLRLPHVQVAALTGGTAATQELIAGVRKLAAQGTLSSFVSRHQPFDVPGSGGPQLRGAAAKYSPRVYVVVAQPVSAVSHHVRGFVLAELITGGALIALLAIGGEWLIGRGLDPLGKMAATAGEITSKGDLTTRMTEASERTEVGQLGAAINTMLDRIQHAFGARLRSEQKVREFAADASHELRTPLTTIRGYAELYRQGALGPDQLPSAMRRIEQEAERMSTLVAELLELARLDRTSSLDLTETDLASVVRDAVADAVAVEPERPVRAEAPPRLVAVVDEPRIRQVLANLLGNVRAHTPVTTPVAVRLGQLTGGVLLEVADAGPGMPAADAARAFDRFHRAGERPGSDGSGPVNGGNGAGAGAAAGRAGAGSGLGLSIVQAIAAAHGGRATLESWEGKGTRVRIWLPERAPGAALRGPG